MAYGHVFYYFILTFAFCNLTFDFFLGAFVAEFCFNGFDSVKR